MLNKFLLAAATMAVAVMAHAADGEKTVRDAFASLLPNATRPQRNLTKKTAASYARVGNRVG